MPLSPIQMPNPVVIQQETTVYDRIWINTININADDPSQPVQIYISATPFSSATGQCLRDQMVHIRLNDLFAAMAADETGTLAQGVGAIYQAVQFLAQQQGLLGLTPNPAPGA